MKIACFVGEFPCLSETFILNQIIGLIKHGHTIDIYAFKPKSIEKIHPLVTEHNLLELVNYYPDIPENYVFRLLKAIILVALNFPKHPVLILNSLNFIKHRKDSLSLRVLFTLIPFLGIDKKRYDLIHSHFGTAGVIAENLRNINVFSAPLVTTFYGFDLSLVIKKSGPNLYKSLFKHGDLFIAISHLFKLRLIELGCDPKKVIVHHMGIDCQKFTYMPRTLPTNESSIEILSIARLVEKKGIEYAIRAIEKIKNKTKKNIRYRIIGDGVLRKNIERLISELDLENTVFLVGWKSSDEVASILNQTHIFLAPSVTSKEGDQEGMPVAIMEAMAMGLPVISTFHSGIPELIDNDVSGFLVPEKNAEALSEKICYLLENTDKSKEVGLQARRKVESKLDDNVLNQELDLIFRNLIIKNNEL